MAKKISISFKETSKDIALYNAIMNLDDKSHDIKQILYPILVEGSKTIIGLNKPNTDETNTVKIDLGVLDI
ncbi:MAG: circadian clock-controlled protein [Bacillota bacterium]|nr:circadian clock-controlled protein [Bacillota bacterium]